VEVFYIREYSEGHVIGDVLHIISDAKEALETAYDCADICPWGVILEDTKNLTYTWFGTECEQLDEWYEDKANGLVPFNIKCWLDDTEKDL